MKKNFFIIATFAMMALFFGSCDKENSLTETTFTIDASAFPTATDLMVHLVSSESTDEAITIDARIGENVLNITEGEKLSLQADAYYSVILFDHNGQYLVQNFFPASANKMLIQAE